MVLADLLARTIVAPQEMLIGVITAILGAPTLILLIRRRAYLYGSSGPAPPPATSQPYATTASSISHTTR
jgi:hypothetical protein